MTRITYPLKFALALSPSAGAFYEGREGHLTVQTPDGWYVTGELDQELVFEEFQDYEECSWYLSAEKIPEDIGWTPEPLVLLPNDGWIEGQWNSRFDSLLGRSSIRKSIHRTTAVW